MDTKLKSDLKRALLERVVASGLVVGAGAAALFVSEVGRGFFCDISSGVMTLARPKSAHSIGIDYISKGYVMC